MNCDEFIKIGILGGTFNPIHTGHLVIAESARQQYGLNKIIFIPAGKPPHKNDQLLASALNRYEMVKLAIEDNPCFDVSMCEINRNRITYTVDTLKELRGLHPFNTSFYFIIGEDTLLELRTWMNPSLLLQLCTVLVYKRPEVSEELVSKEAKFLIEKFQARIHLIEGPLMDISSTSIRNMLYDRKSVRYLLPDKVLYYIQTNNLYMGS